MDCQRHVRGDESTGEHRVRVHGTIKAQEGISSCLGKNRTDAELEGVNPQKSMGDGAHC